MRKAYILTCNQESERSKFSKEVLDNVGFESIFFNCIPHKNKVLSNKISMLKIYENIANGEDDWVYVFEDDINILKPITILEIIEYENISPIFFYLGVCIPNYYNSKNNLVIYYREINNSKIYGIKGGVRGLHAIAISKQGAKLLLDFAKEYESYEYMDMILEKFSEKYPAPVINPELESYIYGHRGIFFQDRNKFPSTI